jgi:hypothetical protein
MGSSQLFWEEKISCSQWEGPKHALKVPCFSSFKVFEGGGAVGVGNDFFPFCPVHNVFPLCSF